MSPKSSSRDSYKAIDGFDENVIRNKIHEFYTIRQHLPTLRKLHSVLRSDIDYPGSRELLRQTLQTMGFRWKKTNDNRKVLIEKPSIEKQRYTFYAKKKDLEDKGFTLVFVDETWIDTAYTGNRCWQGENMPGVMPPCNRGQRLIFVHAGSRTGFIKGAKLVYKASSSTGDYHREMNGHNFTKWLIEMLLPNLTGKCAIVMDNASYNSMQSDKSPTSSTRKEDIKVILK